MTIHDQAKKQLVKTAQDLTARGLLSGTGGNLSMRMPAEDLFAITPSNYDYLKMQPEDICVLDFSLRQREGVRPASVESAMHAAVYQVRQDVNAIIHTHQVYPSVLAVIGKPIPALFDEQVRFLGRSINIIPYEPSGSVQLAQSVANQALDHHNAYIIGSHGALLFGHDMERAFHNVLLLEKCASVYLLALVTGEKVSLVPDEKREEFFSKLREDQLRVERSK